MERRVAVLLLRYRTETPLSNARRFCSYNRIAQITKLAYNQVQHICRQAIKRKRKQKDLSRLLEDKHIQFLTDAKTLELWSGKTLKERCILFHRKFPNKKIAVTSLRRLYLKNKLRRKKVRQDKYLPCSYSESFAEQCRELL